MYANIVGMSERVQPDLQMRRGLRIFVECDGAFEEPSLRILAIRAKCNTVLADRGVPLARSVHYLIPKNTSHDPKATCSACDTVEDNIYGKKLTKDNSTTDVAYVSCKSCRNTKAFRKANGEAVADKVVVHLHDDNGAYKRLICNSWMSSTSVSNATADVDKVTCGNCKKTKDYKAKLEKVSV